MTVEQLTPDTRAEREELAIDLQKQIAELRGHDQKEMEMRIIESPDRVFVLLYSRIDGEKISVPLYIAKQAMRTGRWTANPEQAPTFRYGTTKCFLHPDAPERTVLNEIGMAQKVCEAAKLANEYARDIHAQRKHRMEFAAYQNYLAAVEKEEDRQLQRDQINATLDLARAATGKKNA